MCMCLSTELCGWNGDVAGCELNKQLQTVEAEFDFDSVRGKHCNRELVSK